MNRRTSMKVTATTIALTLACTTGAKAGERSLLSELPSLPQPRDAADPPKEGPTAKAVAGLSLKEVKGYGGSTYVEATAATAKGYCFVSKQYGLRLTSSSTSSPYEDEMWRFTEIDGKTSLERTRFQIVPSEKGAWLKSRTAINLKAVAQSNGVTVWGFRDSNGDVVLIAQGASSGRESVRPPASEGDGTSFQFVSSECTWGITRISAHLAKSGGVANLHGSLPPVGEGKQKVAPRFIVNGSVMKVTRDPEPVLAVSIHMVDT